MEIESSPQGVTQRVQTACMAHKAHLASKYAFLFGQDIINKVKNNNFMKPPRRAVEDFDLKLEMEASTSASSVESSAMSLEEIQVKSTIAAGMDDQATTTNQVMELFLTFEEGLQLSIAAPSAETVSQVRKLNRQSLALVLGKPAKFRKLPKDAIALAAVLRTCERLGLDTSSLTAFITTSPHLKRFNTLAKIRASRAYLLLANPSSSPLQF